MDDKDAESCAQNDVNSEENTKTSLDPASNEGTGIVDDAQDGNAKSDEQKDVVMRESSDNDLHGNCSIDGGKSNLAVLKRKLNSSSSGITDINADSKDTDGGSLSATTPTSASPLHASNLSSKGDVHETGGGGDGSKNATSVPAHPGAETNGNDTDIEMHDATANASAEVNQTRVSSDLTKLEVLKSMHDSGQKN